MKNIKQTEVYRRHLIRAAHPQPGPGVGPPHDVVLLVQIRIAGSAATASSSSSDMSQAKAASSVQSRSSMVSFMASILSRPPAPPPQEYHIPASRTSGNGSVLFPGSLCHQRSFSASSRNASGTDREAPSTTDPA